MKIAHSFIEKKIIKNYKKENNSVLKRERKY